MKWLLFGAVLMMGCKSSLGPLKGQLLILQSIEGIPLPAPYAENRNLDFRIIADTIALQTYDAGERRTRIEVDGAGNTRMDIESFSYVRTGDRVEITFPCPPNALCIKPPHLAGTLTESSFIVDQSVISRKPLVYRRMAILE
jgi:hypothetical protein